MMQKGDSEMQVAKESHLPSVKMFMGDTVSYVTAASLSWIVAHVELAADFPVWRNKRDPETGKVIIDASTIDELRQREPDWRRQIPMVRYLALRQHHKFPPMLAVAWQPWVNDFESDKWTGGRANEDSIAARQFGPNDTSLYELSFKDTKLYALDGQHRLMAIRGLSELVNDGKLVVNGALLGKPSNAVLRLDDVIGELRSIDTASRTKMQDLMQDRIGIEIIPAIHKNDTYSEAGKRLRSIFVHVNKHAKVLQRSELALLDEDDGYAIIARNAMTKHQLLKNRVHTSLGQLQEHSNEYTTLENLVSMARLYLGQMNPCAKWQLNASGDDPHRPSEQDLEMAYSQYMDLFDELCSLDSHNALASDPKKSASIYRIAGKHENILFRPIAQSALVRALGQLVVSHSKQLSAIMKTLIDSERGGKLVLRERNSIWFGVLCTVDYRIRKRPRSRNLCAELLVHLLGGRLTKARLLKLTERYRQARATDAEKDNYVGADGSDCNAESITLPEPWT